MSRSTPPSFLKSAERCTSLQWTRLRLELGWEGVGIAHAVEEEMRKCPDYQILGTDLPAVALKLSIEPEKLASVLAACVSAQIFALVDGFFSSPELTTHMASYDAKAKAKQSAGRAGGLAKAKHRCSTARPVLQQNPSTATATLEQCSSLRESTLTPLDLKEVSAKGECEGETPSSARAVPEQRQDQKPRGPSGRVRLSDSESRRVIKFYRDKNLSTTDAQRAVERLDTWLANPENAAGAYDHAGLLTGWVYRAILEERTEEARHERAKSLAPVKGRPTPPVVNPPRKINREPMKALEACNPDVNTILAGTMK